MNAIDACMELAIRHSARTARKTLAEAGLLAWSRTLALPEGPAAIMDCLRRLGCLTDWWPDALDIRPLPAGLCQPGDAGLLETSSEELLLRVLAFRPRRLILALAGQRMITIVDLAIRESEGGCELTIRLERPAPGWPVADQWAARRLSTFGSKAAARMEWHLRQRAITADDKAR